MTYKLYTVSSSGTIPFLHLNVSSWITWYLCLVFTSWSVVQNGICLMTVFVHWENKQITSKCCIWCEICRCVLCCQFLFILHKKLLTSKEEPHFKQCFTTWYLLNRNQWAFIHADFFLLSISLQLLKISSQFWKKTWEFTHIKMSKKDA